jgi:hypothetical protein
VTAVIALSLEPGKARFGKDSDHLVGLPRANFEREDPSWS